MKKISYWEKRALEDEKEIHIDTINSLKKQIEAIEDARFEIQKKVRQYLGEFKDLNRLNSISKSRELIDQNEMEEFKWSISKFIEKSKEYESLKDKSSLYAIELDNQIKNASLKYRINRQEHFISELNMEILRLTETRLQLVKEHLEKVIETTARQVEKDNKELDVLLIKENEILSSEKETPTIKVTNSTIKSEVKLEPKITDKKTNAKVVYSNRYKHIENAVNERWIGNKNFSERIWGDSEKLGNFLKENIPKHIALGDRGEGLIKKMKQVFNTSKSNAKRLLFTETARIMNKTKQEVFLGMGFDKVRLVATLDMRTSEICQEKDANIVELSNAVMGVDLPPFHPYCRTVFTPYTETLEQLENEVRDRSARDPITNKKYTTNENSYRDWENSTAPGSNKKIKDFIKK